ncbi:MAG TPA: glycosyltransferase [Polyangiaceae bacterium]|nr:glycosyltransferase [Polyangiaceae bacterium]
MSTRTLLFIPTYNEKHNVAPMCEQLAALGLDADIVFLDDDSPDGTGQLLDDLARRHPRVSVIHRYGQRGVGGAHLEGIAYAYDKGYARLVTMDCDFTHSPRDIPRLIEQSIGADVTVGSRHLEAGSLPGWTLMRQLLTRFGHVVTRALLGFSHDATGALRVYDLTRIPRELFGLVQARGYAFFFESLFVIHANGFVIRDVPIVLPARTYGSSKMNLREVERSVEQLVRLAVAKSVHPARFVVDRPLDDLNPSLYDPQGWDEYWSAKTKATGLVYDVIAASYRNVVIKRRLTRTIRRVFPAGAKLLHAGCGSGQVDTDLHDHVRITAVDVSAPALKMYRRENPQVAAIKHASIFDLPFADGTFDGAYNLGVVEHFTADELTRALREIRRVLKPNGKLVVFWPHARATSVMVLGGVHWVMREVLKRNDRLHPPEVSLVHNRAEARAILQAGGFELVSYDFGAGDFFVQAIVVAERSAEPPAYAERPRQAAHG